MAVRILHASSTGSKHCSVDCPGCTAAQCADCCASYRMQYSAQHTLRAKCGSHAQRSVNTVQLKQRSLINFAMQGICRACNDNAKKQACIDNAAQSLISAEVDS
jgi:hypothetical protein